MIGGYNRFGKGATASATFSNIPAHTELHIKFDLWGIDSWDNECFYAKVDNQEVFKVCKAYNEG